MTRNCRATLWCTHVPDGGDEQVEVRIKLTWRPAAPWWVDALIGTVRWDLPRDLLIDGLTHRAGHGDVVVRPVSWSEVEMVLTGRRRCCAEETCGCGPPDYFSVALRLPDAELRRFLGRTERAVPRGTYPAFDDFAHEVQGWLEVSA